MPITTSAINSTVACPLTTRLTALRATTRSTVQTLTPTLNDVFLAKTGRSLEGAGEEEDHGGPGARPEVRPEAAPA